jgi:3-deoxy-D-manno-octulosonic-acid transferase
METELWPNFLRECASRRIPVALVNGRLSEGSFRRY